jgi:hypothetical protein
VAEEKHQNADDAGDAPILSEQEWAEFERSFTKESTKTAVFKEPSARQRALVEKWKRQRPQEPGWRRDGVPADHSDDHPAPPRDPRPPAGYGTERRRRWRRNVAWVVLAALVTSAIIGVPRLFSSSKGGNDRNPNVPPASGTPDGTGGAGASTNPGAGSGAGAGATASVTKSASATAPASAAGRDTVRFSVPGADCGCQLVMVAPENSRVV